MCLANNTLKQTRLRKTKFMPLGSRLILALGGNNAYISNTTSQGLNLQVSSFPKNHASDGYVLTKNKYGFTFFGNQDNIEYIDLM